MINETYLQNMSHVLQINAIKQSGLKIEALSDGYAKVVMPIAGNMNHVNIMYAGSLCMLGEIMGGIKWAVMFDVNRFFPIVKEFSIKYKRPATTDIFIEHKFSEEEAVRIQKEAETIGKCDYPMELELKDTDGQTVAVVNGVWQIRTLTNEL
jgi:acyl-coenzyme A thioesterase PaaI-like protein